MINTIRYYGSVTMKNLQMQIQTQLEYPASWMGWLLANPIQFIIGLSAISFVIKELGALNGWSYGEIVFLYGLSVISHAVKVIFFVQTWYIGSYVRHGQFDQYCLRPMSILFQFFTSNFNVIGFTDMIPSIIIFAAGCNMVGFHWTLINTAGFIIVIIGATLIRTSLDLLAGIVSFWYPGYNMSLIYLSGMLMDRTTQYPLAMYPRVIQIIFTFICPLGFISFYPASAFLGKDSLFAFPPSILWATLALGVATFSIAVGAFKISMKRYESSGT